MSKLEAVVQGHFDGINWCYIVDQDEIVCSNGEPVKYWFEVSIPAQLRNVTLLVGATEDGIVASMTVAGFMHNRDWLLSELTGEVNALANEDKYGHMLSLLGTKVANWGLLERGGNECAKYSLTRNNSVSLTMTSEDAVSPEM